MTPSTRLACVEFGFERVPGGFAAGAVAAEHRFAIGIFDAVDIDFDFVADLELGLLAGQRRIRAAATRPSRLQADVDDREVIFDRGDGALDDAAFKALVSSPSDSSSIAAKSSRVGWAAVAIKYVQPSNRNRHLRDCCPVVGEIPQPAPLPAVRRRRGGTMPTAPFVSSKAARGGLLTRSGSDLLLVVLRNGLFDKRYGPLDGRVYTQFRRIEQGGVFGAPIGAALRPNRGHRAPRYRPAHRSRSQASPLPTSSASGAGRALRRRR